MKDFLHKPQISVLMTIYNAENYLAYSLDSLINQSYKDWILIAIENGSIDNSLKILENYQDDRIHIYKFEKNIGRTPALIYALKQVKTPYIAVLDADDYAYKDRFKKQIDYFEQNSSCVLCGTWATYIDEKNKIFDVWEPPVNHNELVDCFGWINPFVNSSVMFKAEAARKVGGYSDRYIYAQDFALFIELAKEGKVHIINEYLCQLRVLNTSMTRSLENRTVVASEIEKLLKHAAKEFVLSRVSKKKHRKSIALNSFKLGIAAIINKKMLHGLMLIINAVVSCPSIILDNGIIRNFVNKGNRNVFIND